LALSIIVGVGGSGKTWTFIELDYSKAILRCWTGIKFKEVSEKEFTEYCAFAVRAKHLEGN
jgi:hypothetical protein